MSLVFSILLLTADTLSSASGIAAGSGYQLGRVAKVDEKLFSKRNNRGRYGRKQIEPDGWFNPAFQKFVNTEIATENQ